MSVKRVFENRASYILYNLFKGRKGKVLVQANICPIVPAVLIKAGVQPYFVDIDPQTFSTSQASILRLLKEDSQVMGFIHAPAYGFTSREAADFLGKLKQEYPSLFIVDDRCLARPEFELEDFSADAVIFSTGYSKIAELGWGAYGYLKQDVGYERHPLRFDETSHDQLVALFNESIQGRKKMGKLPQDWLDAGEPDVSFDEYRGQVEQKLEIALAHKKRLNEIYDSYLGELVGMPEGYNLWRYTIRVPEKERLLSSIFEKGFFASSHYANLSEIYADQEAPVAQKFSDEVVNLFNDHRFDEESAESVAQIVLEFLHHNNSSKK